MSENMNLVPDVNGLVVPSEIHRCEDCIEIPDDGTCDKCGDSILTTKDAYVPNAPAEARVLPSPRAGCWQNE